MHIDRQKLRAIQLVLTGKTSKAEAAFRLGLGHSTVCTLTRGHQSPGFRYVRVVANKLGGEDLIATDDADLGRPWSRGKRQREYMTHDEVEKLLAASKTASRNPERDYCMLLLMFRHGLRVSELCSMKLTDINLDIKEFHMPRLKGYDSGPHELYNGESQAIRAWLAERAEMNPPAGVDTLFISERRKSLSRVTVWSMVKLTAAAAGLGHLEIHPHMLRHSCGYALVNRGIDIRTIQGYLGHRAISSTAQYTSLDRKQFAGLF